MKHLKKLLVVVAALVLAMAMTATAFAAESDGTITVNNAAKGETYAVYKVLDATINNAGGIDYTGTIPNEFADILEATTVGEAPNTYSAIGVKEGVTQDQINTALKAYAVRISGADSYDALVQSRNFTNADASITATGNSVSFSVDPGFYVVVSSQGTVVMADSATNPATAINEKNTTEPSVDKTVEKQSYSIGDTVKYTAVFDSANYVDGKPVTSYVISDTLPEFLSDVTITSVRIVSTPASPAIGTEGEEGYVPAVEEVVVEDLSGNYNAFDSNKSITIPWATFADGKWTSKYNNGVLIIVEYQGTLTSVTNIDTADTNTITINPKVGTDEGEEEPYEKEWHDSAVIKTYAAAIKKVDENGQPLAGATFTFKGLTVTGENGVYTVTGYDPRDTAAESPALSTDSKGKLYIIGLASDVKLVVTEATAPDGYNKLNGTKELEPQLLTEELYKEDGAIYYDAQGNVVSEQSSATTTKTVEKNLSELDENALTIQNNKGTELPSTGGMGTTILYIVGGIMVLLAVVFLITKKRVANKKNDHEMI